MYKTLPIFCLLWVSTVGRRIYVKDEDWFTKRGNPGLKMRLTDKGVNYIRQLAINILNAEVPLIKGLSAKGALGQANVNLQNINITRWRAADYTLLQPSPPNKLVFGLENADLGLEGDFIGKQGPFTLPGRIEGELRGMTIAAEMALTNAGGGIKIQAKSCKAVVQTTTLQVIPDPRNPLAGLVRGHLPAINNALRAFLPTVLCKGVQGALNGIGGSLVTPDKLKIGISPDALKETIADLQPQPEAAAKVEETQVAHDPREEIAKQLLDHAMVDMTIMKNPIATNDYVELWHRANVYYSDNPVATPFHPRPMPDIQDTRKMIYIELSDYVMNAMFYQMYLNERMNSKITADKVPPPLKNFLRTSCSKGSTGGDAAPKSFRDAVTRKICLGSLVPSLNKEYPDQIVDLEFIPHALPDFQARDGKGLFNMLGRILVYAKDSANRRRQVLVVNCDLAAESEITMSEQRITGDLQIKKLDLTVHRTSLRHLNPRNVEQLSPVAKQILAPELSKLLKEGFPLPLQEILTVYDPDVHVHDGYVLVSADFELDEENLQKQFQEKIKSTLGGQLEKIAVSA